jgi:hypothetical protein
VVTLVFHKLPIAVIARIFAISPASSIGPISLIARIQLTAPIGLLFARDTILIEFVNSDGKNRLSGGTTRPLRSLFTGSAFNVSSVIISKDKLLSNTTFV